MADNPDCHPHLEKVFKERRKKWVPKEEKYKSGILSIYSKNAVDPMLGGYMK